MLTGRPALRSRHAWVWSCLLAGCTWMSGAALAAGATQGPSWVELTPAQRLSLQPLESQWNKLSASRKNKWLEIAARFPTLPRDRQIRLQARMTEWAGMSTAQRNDARIRFEETRRLAGEDRQALWEAYQALPPEQRKALADKAIRRAQPAPVAPAVALGQVPRTGGKSVTAPNVAAVASSAARTVAPGTVQAGVGASTRPITQQPLPPRHQQVGMPKIAATAGFVDRNTLLPQRGPQAAAAVPVRAASR